MDLETGVAVEVPIKNPEAAGERMRNGHEEDNVCHVVHIVAMETNKIKRLRG